MAEKFNINLPEDLDSRKYHIPGVKTAVFILTFKHERERREQDQDLYFLTLFEDLAFKKKVL